jgi:hypothetical protein
LNRTENGKCGFNEAGKKYDFLGIKEGVSTVSSKTAWNRTTHLTSLNVRYHSRCQYMQYFNCVQYQEILGYYKNNEVKRTVNEMTDDLTSSFSSMKLRQPSLGTKAVIFLPFLISWTRTHLRIAELGCLASTPTWNKFFKCFRAI